MSEMELEELWPDRRPGSKGGRKRKPVVHSDLQDESAALLKLEHEQQPEQMSHDHDLQQLEVETCDYLIQEEDDPWGHLANGLGLDDDDDL